MKHYDVLNTVTMPWGYQKAPNEDLGTETFASNQLHLRQSQVHHSRSRMLLSQKMFSLQLRMGYTQC